MDLTWCLCDLHSKGGLMQKTPGLVKGTDLQHSQQTSPQLRSVRLVLVICFGFDVSLPVFLVGFPPRLLQKSKMAVGDVGIRSFAGQPCHSLLFPSLLQDKRTSSVTVHQNPLAKGILRVRLKLSRGYCGACAGMLVGNRRRHAGTEMNRNSGETQELRAPVCFLTRDGL